MAIKNSLTTLVQSFNHCFHSRPVFGDLTSTKQCDFRQFSRLQFRELPFKIFVVPQNLNAPAKVVNETGPNLFFRQQILVAPILCQRSFPSPLKDTTASSQKSSPYLAREDYIDLRQEAVDLQEYSNAKLDRVTWYLGAVADKTRKLGEGPSVVEFPDDFTIRVNTEDDSVSNSKKDFEFDRVYGPHIGQAEIFTDVQPFVQSALDGHNVSIFSYGQTHSGKTHTMEGSTHDRGLYARCFEELFDVSNLDTTSTSRFNFFLSIFELHNEQIKDLLSVSGSSLPKVRMGSPDSSVDLVQEKIDNPLDFSRVLKKAFLNRGVDTSKTNGSHLIMTVQIYYDNLITGENSYRKLSLVDLAGSESSTMEDDSGEQTTDCLHVMKSLSALGDVLTSLSSKKDSVPYTNSMLTKFLADSLGGSSKTLLTVNICPNASNVSETLSSFGFSSRARNAALSLGNRDTIKKWKDVASSSELSFT